MGIGKVMMLFALFAISSSIIAQNHDSLYVELIGGQPVIADTAYANDAARTLSTNVYKYNGTLTGNRTLGLGGFDLDMDVLYLDASSENVGIGTTAPGAALHYRSSTLLGSTIGDYQVLAIAEGETGNDIKDFKFISRNETGSTWTTASFFNGLGIDNSFNTPSTLRAFWERDIQTGEHHLGSSGVRRLSVMGDGNVGIGTSAPESKLQVESGDVYISTISKGVILKSPDGTCWRWTPANTTGAVTATSITCP